MTLPMFGEVHLLFHIFSEFSISTTLFEETLNSYISIFISWTLLGDPQMSFIYAGLVNQHF